MEETSNRTRRTFTGKVVSHNQQKTAVVEVSRYQKHPRVGKYQTIYKKFKAHDPENKVAVGETVTIVESRPLSRDKHFTVVYN